MSEIDWLVMGTIGWIACIIMMLTSTEPAEIVMATIGVVTGWLAPLFLTMIAYAEFSNKY